MRVLVTGVSGNLGHLLAERLAQAPEVECLTGIDIAEPKKKLPAKVEFVKIDIRSSDLAQVMAGHDVVIHTAFIVNWLAKMPAEERKDININGSCNVARAAVANHVRRFVLASSTAAYDIPLIIGKTGVTEDTPVGKGNQDFYCNDKSASERAVTEIMQGSGVIYTILRPGQIAGPSSSAMLLPTRTSPARFTAAKLPGRSPRVQVVHEDDVVAAFVQAALTDMPGACNIAPDDFIRMDEVWKIAGVNWIPILPVRIMKIFVRFNWKYLGSPTHPAWLAASMGDWTMSNAKLKATGWKPQYGSAETVRATVNTGSNRNSERE